MRERKWPLCRRNTRLANTRPMSDVRCPMPVNKPDCLSAWIKEKMHIREPRSPGQRDNTMLPQPALVYAATNIGKRRKAASDISFLRLHPPPRFRLYSPNGGGPADSPMSLAKSHVRVGDLSLCFCRTCYPPCTACSSNLCW